MSEENALPRGWIYASLQDIAPPGGTRNPKTNHEDVFFYVDIEAVDNIAQKIAAPKQIKTSNAPSRARMAIQAGDVIFSLVRPYLKNIAIVPQELDGQVASTAYCVMRPESGVLSSFVFYAFLRESFIDSIVTYGNSPPSAHDDEFLAMIIPLAPTNEQQRIVAAIEQQFTRLDAGIAALKRAHAKLKRYRAAVLKAAVEGNLTEAWRAEYPTTEPASILLERILKERRAKWEADLRAKGKDPAKAKYVEPAKPDMEGLPELPEGWVWTNMGCIIVYGPQNGLYLPRSAYGTGIPILRIDDFQNGTSRSSSQLRLVNAKSNEVATYSLYQGDMVINRVNSPSHLGKCLVVSERNLPSVFESNMMRLRLSEMINAKFVEVYLHSSLGRDCLIANAKWAVNQASINQYDVSNTALPLPPIIEQHRIVSEVEQRLSIVTQLETIVDANLKRAERLRQSILKEAFAGRLVPQDPNDEPASVLLERIRKEREGQKKGANGNGRFVRVSDEPVQIDVEGTRQVELWEGVGEASS